MITLTNGLPQGPNGLIVPNGSIGFQLNVDAVVIAAPYGFVSGSIEVVFQFDANGLIQPNAPAAAAQIYSNKELNPQNIVGLGTYYLVTFYDADGARINKNPMWWQFPEAANATVNISNMTPISTIGGNVIFYPTNFGGSGSVTSVAFVGDGTILSATPSTPVTTSGDISATLLTQSAMLFLAGPLSGPAANPTFRAIALTDLPATLNVWSSLLPASADLILANTTFNTTFTQTGTPTWKWANITASTSLANQSSPIISIQGTCWNSSASITDGWTIQSIPGSGANPTTTLTFTHSGSSTTPSINIPYPITLGTIQSGGMTALGNVNITGDHEFSNQTQNGAEWFMASASEEITLNTGGTTTDSSTNLLPAGAIIHSVLARVTQTISGGSTPTTWEAGDATTAARFISTGNALTAGTTAVGLNQMAGSVSTDAAGPTQAAAAKVRITLDQIPGQGKVRITVYYSQFTAPTS